MTDEERNSKSFWTTMPGILSGLAAMLAAVVGLLQIFLNQGEDNGTPSPDWMTRNQYQQAFNSKVRDGFYPHKVEARCHDDYEQFRIEWKGIPIGVSFLSHSIMNKDDYENKDQRYRSRGYSLERLNKFKDCADKDRYQALWLRRR